MVKFSYSFDFVKNCEIAAPTSLVFFKSVQFIFPGFDCTKNGKIRIQDFVRLVQPQPQSIGMFWLFH
jgi:hypothetical protein